MSKKPEEPARERGPWPLGTTFGFFVGGVDPVAKGSMRAFVPKSWAASAAKAGKAPRAVVTDGAGKELRSYESAVRNAARRELDRRGLPCALRQPFEVIVGFFFKRSDGDFDPHGHVLASARLTPWIAPDIDKLTRATFDALRRFVYDDDSRVVRMVVEKRYSDAHTDLGTWIQVKRLAATVREANAARQPDLLMRRTEKPQ